MPYYSCDLTIPPQFASTKKKKKRKICFQKLDYIINEELLCLFYYSVWDNFTGISAHFMVLNHQHCNDCDACFNVKTLLSQGGFSLKLHELEMKNLSYSCTADRKCC